MLDDGVGFTPFPRGGAGAPTLVASGTGRLDGFVMKDNLLWWATLQEGPADARPTWPARPQQLPGNRSETGNVAVSAVSTISGEIDVFGVGIGRFDGRILHWSYRDGRWVQRALPATGAKAAKTRPTAVTRGPGLVDVFATSEDGTILRWLRNGPAWETRPALRIPDGGARRTLPPAVAVARPNRMDVAVIGDSPEGRRLWHWWCDDGVGFSDPEKVGPAVELAEVAVGAAWAGGRGRGIEPGMLLTIAAISEGGLLKPRTLVQWVQGPGRWGWERTRRDRARGFSSDGDAAQVWLESTQPSVVPVSAPAPVVTVSAPRNVFEKSGLSRSLVIWDGSDTVIRVGRAGPTERGFGLVTRPGRAVDALVDMRDGVIHAWSGHHVGLPVDLDPVHDLVAEPSPDGVWYMKRLTWQIRRPWWNPESIEYVVRHIAGDGTVLEEAPGTRESFADVKLEVYVKRDGGVRTEWVRNPETGRLEQRDVPVVLIEAVRVRKYQVIATATATAGPVAEWLGRPIRRSSMAEVASF
jgi:hypothetical protein